MGWMGWEKGSSLLNRSSPTFFILFILSIL